MRSGAADETAAAYPPGRPQTRVGSVEVSSGGPVGAPARPESRFQRAATGSVCCNPSACSQSSASMAAAQPVPAAVTACW